MLLKTHPKGNKQIALHPALIRQGILDIERIERGRLFPEAKQTSSTWSQTFLRVAQSRHLREGEIYIPLAAKYI